MSAPDATPNLDIPTLYDETYRGIHAPSESQIMTFAPGTNLIAKLEHHAPTTDGSVGICIASTANVTAISKALYESIPEAHRPELDTSSSVVSVKSALGAFDKTLGHIFLPMILTDSRTNKPFRIVLFALVLPNLFPPMFMSAGSQFVSESRWGNNKVKWVFDFDGRKVGVNGT